MIGIHSARSVQSESNSRKAQKRRRVFCIAKKGYRNSVQRYCFFLTYATFAAEKVHKAPVWVAERVLNHPRITQESPKNHLRLSAGDFGEKRIENTI